MHVLWLPSWYPKAPSDLRGSFFREQALALHSTGCKVGVIAPSLGSLRSPFSSLKVSNKIHCELDEDMPTYRQARLNWLPRMWFLNASRISSMVRSLFDMYVEENGMPDLIHLHSLLPAGVGALEILKRDSIPYILSEHSSAFARAMVSKQEIASARDIAKSALARFAVSTSTANIMKTQLGPEAGLWSTFPNPVSQFFLDGQIRSGNPDKYRFLHVSSLDTNKNAELILSAFSESFKGMESVELVIGGDGPEQPALIEKARILGIRKQVHFTGSLTRLEVRDQLTLSDAFVLTSRYETFGIVLVEAMAVGCPIIATTCGGPEDIVTPEVGVLVAKDDVGELAIAMRRMCSERSNYNADKIRENCRIRFGPDDLTRRWISVYEKCLRKKNTR